MPSDEEEIDWEKVLATGPQLAEWQRQMAQIKREDDIYSHPGDQYAKECPDCEGTMRMYIENPTEVVACKTCQGRGYVVEVERVTQFFINCGRGIGKTAANKQFEKICEEFGITIKKMEPVVRNYGDQIDSLRYALAAMQEDKFRQARDAMNSWMDEIARNPILDELKNWERQARQDYPTDEDEVCCICHEDIGGGYPPEAYERRQAPYTYVDDLQGWAHDLCAKEYFSGPEIVPDLKPSRTERLP